MPIVLYAQEDKLGETTTDFIEVSENTSIPRGVEAYFQYNNFVFNDRDVTAKYRILHIDGLDDADVRDTREDNPSQHGENALNALYGGRTLAFNGRIEAFTLAKLRKMQRALRNAFADLQEKDLIFLTESPETDHYIKCRKFSKLQWTEEQTHATAFYRDFLITLRASDPRFYLVQPNIHTFYTNQILNGGFETNDTGWATYNPSTGFSSTTKTPQSGWSSVGTYAERITGTKANNATLHELGITTNNVIDTVIIPDETYTIRADINVLNKGTDGYLVVFWYASDGSTLLQTDQQNIVNDVGEQIVQFDIDAPSNAAYAKVRFALQSNVANDIVDYYIDNIWLTRKGSSSAAGEIHLPNEGNIETFPRIFLHGPLTNLSFTLITQDGVEREFQLNDDVEIPLGQYYEIRSADRRLLRSDGENKIADMDINSDWPVLEAGDNIFKVTAQQAISDPTGQGYIEIYYRDAFI